MKIFLSRFFLIFPILYGVCAPIFGRLKVDIQRPHLILAHAQKQYALDRTFAQSHQGINKIPGVSFARHPDLGGHTSFYWRGLKLGQVMIMQDGIDLADPSMPGYMANINHENFSSFQKVSVINGPLSGLYGLGHLGGIISFESPLADQQSGSYSHMSQRGLVTQASQSIHYNAPWAHGAITLQGAHIPVGNDRPGRPSLPYTTGSFRARHQGTFKNLMWDNVTQFYTAQGTYFSNNHKERLTSFNGTTKWGLGGFWDASKRHYTYGNILYFQNERIYGHRMWDDDTNDFGHRVDIFQGHKVQSTLHHTTIIYGEKDKQKSWGQMDAGASFLYMHGDYPSVKDRVDSQGFGFLRFSGEKMHQQNVVHWLGGLSVHGQASSLYPVGAMQVGYDIWNRRLGFWAGIGNAVKFPSLDQRFSGYGTDFAHIAIRGNPDLLPEKGFMGEVGVRSLCANGYAEMSAVAFYSKIYDLITIQSFQDTFDYSTYMNTDYSNRWGMETSLRSHAINQINFSFNHTFIDGNMITSTKKIPYLYAQPRHHMWFDATLFGNSAFQLKHTFHLMGERIMFGRRKYEMMPVYGTYDIIGTWRYHTCEWDVGVLNVTNEFFENPPGYPGIERTFYFGFRYIAK